MKEQKLKKKPKLRVPPRSRATKPRKKGAVVVIGKSYIDEILQQMISNLRSEEREKSITAAIKFASESKEIKESMEGNEKFNSEKIYDEVLAVIENNNQIVIDILKETKRIPALTFIANSEKLPEVTRFKAQDVLFPLQIEKPKEKFTQKSYVAPKVSTFTPRIVKTLWKRMNSTTPKIRIKAAILFFANYSKIAPVMSKIPNLTITQLMVKAKDVTFRNTDPLFREIIKTWNRAALGFLGKSESMPPEIRKKAKVLMKKYFPEKVVKLDLKKPKKAIEPKTKSEVKKPETKIDTKEPETKSAYNVKKVKLVWANLQSRQKTIAIKAAIEVFSNFQNISQVMPKIPMLNITQVVGKATEIASRNSSAFFRRLSLSKNKKALNFLVKSDIVKKDLTATAMELLALLDKKPKKDVEEPKLTYKSEEPPEESDEET
jgi:hypothetical protein